MIASLEEVLKDSIHQQYAVAAFNIYGYEDAQGCVEAAEELKAPVILAVNRRALEYMPLEVIGPMLEGLAEKASVPVVIHLDHATDYQTIVSALKNGFSSIMFDGSSLPIEENIQQTLEIKKLVHAFGVHIEAEIGRVGYTNYYKEIATEFTNVADASYYYNQTKVDALAVSVGTTHRMETPTAEIDFELIKEIESKVDCPLVLHGASGVPKKDLQRLAKETNFGKINIGTVIRKAFGDSMRQQMMQDPDVYDRLEIFPQAIDEVRKVAKEYIKLLY